MKKKVIQFRVTEQQEKYLKDKAEKKGMTISEYVRYNVLKEYFEKGF